MKRSIITIFFILVCVCLGWFFQNRMLSKLFTQADSSLSKIVNLIEKQEYSSAHKEFNIYNKRWEKKENILCALVSHEDIDFITRCNGQLRAYIKTPGEEEAYAVISELYESYRELRDKFKVNIKTIL
ncbi:MAG: DUF4363 family protein [Clostridia bacterium]|nr:DUF4363 family protein [Clostridia bacterium]